MKFIHKSEISSSTPGTYSNFVCDHRPLKSEPWGVQLVVGDDKLPYLDDPGLPAANLLETKLLLNSVISYATMGACFMSINLKDHFLSSPMNKSGYRKIHQKYLPLDIIHQYNLPNKIYYNYISCKIIKGMYGLKHAVSLAHNFLQKI